MLDLTFLTIVKICFNITINYYLVGTRNNAHQARVYKLEINFKRFT